MVRLGKNRLNKDQEKEIDKNIKENFMPAVEKTPEEELSPSQKDAELHRLYYKIMVPIIKQSLEDAIDGNGPTGQKSD